MYWEVENEGVLRAAIDAGVVPPEVQAAPLKAAHRDDGSLRLAPSVDLSKDVRMRCKRAGLRQRRGPLGAAEELGCWAEVFATRQAEEPRPPLGDVLFLQAASDSGSLALSGELLRLGCDRQELCFFSQGSEDTESVLCRVAEPPYYVVLRAREDDGLRAFLPSRPGSRVWVELGASHPMADRVELPPGELLLIPAEGRWQRVPDGPWTDLLDCADVVLPEQRLLEVSEVRERLRVELRLARAPRREPPRLWVLRDDAAAQMQRLIRTLPEEVLAQLLFTATPGEDGTETVVLRARSGEQKPPALEVEGESYVPLLKIPNLYVPLGMTVTPPLRQARLRALLAGDPDTVVWTAPLRETQVWTAPEDGGETGPFRLERVRAEAFAPLDEWVDYVAAANAGVLERWVRAAVFDLEGFVSIGVEWSERPSPEKQRREKEEAFDEDESDDEEPEEEDVEEARAPATKKRRKKAFELPRVEVEPSAAEVEASRLEDEICGAERPPDDPELLRMWVELGGLQALLKRPDQAALSYTQALWEASPEAVEAIAGRWAETEARNLGLDPASAAERVFGLDSASPSAAELRALAAHVVAGAPDALPQVFELQKLFSEHETELPLRARWLLRRALASWTGGDRLGLLRTRDGILDEMRAGMPVARNVPGFIRLRGRQKSADTFELHKDLAELLERYQKTKRKLSMIEQNGDGRTDAYVLLLFAWGEARLGRAAEAEGLLSAAREALADKLADGADDEVHDWCLAAYEARVQQALAGLSVGAPLPAELIARRDAMGRMARYKVDRLRQGSRILENSTGLDPFRDFHRPARSEAFAGLPALGADELAVRLDGILDDEDAATMADRLDGVLDLLDLLPESLALPRLEKCLALLSSSDAGSDAVELVARPPLIEKALELADFLLRPSLVQQVAAALQEVTRQLAAERPAELAALLARSGPALRRAGIGNRLAELVDELASGLGRGDLRYEDPETAVARLQVETARSALELDHDVSGAFATAYGMLDNLETDALRLQWIKDLGIALSRTTPGQARAGVRQIFERLPKITDSFNTNSHFCVSVVSFMDSLVLALASEDLCLDTWARHWIEDDEHRLRRRIHRDLSST